MVRVRAREANSGNVSFIKNDYCGILSTEGIATAPLLVQFRSKYPPAKPEALRVAGPSKGPYRDPKSKSQASGSVLVADIIEARSILLGLSNFYCLPGRAGGSPVRTRRARGLVPGMGR